MMSSRFARLFGVGGGHDARAAPGQQRREHLHARNGADACCHGMGWDGMVQEPSANERLSHPCRRRSVCDLRQWIAASGIEPMRGEPAEAATNGFFPLLRRGAEILHVGGRVGGGGVSGYYALMRYLRRI